MTAAVGIVGAAAAVAALVPWNGFFSDDAEIQAVTATSGQSTSPNVVVPHPLSEVSRPPDSAETAEFNAWMAEHAAVYAENMSVRFVARTGQIQPTIITALRVEVVERKEPMQGTWIEPDGAGPQPGRIILASLDSDPPTATLDGSFSFPLRISNTDPELFVVRAQARTCHCLWQIELDIIDADGDLTTVVVDDDGKPFELTGTSNAQDRTNLPSAPNSPWPTSN